MSLGRERDLASGRTRRWRVAAGRRRVSRVPFQFAGQVAALYRDGSSAVLPVGPDGPVRVDGLSVGAPRMTRSAPHRGEMHPDGDELLYLISGRVEVILEDGGDV